jgi:hypothetical protein
MKNQSFFLQPFPTIGQLPNLKIAGNIARNNNQLTIEYILQGELKEIAIAPPSAIPSRKHELWQNTCFEFFLGIQNSQRYWEFNLSPSGDWNVYCFDSYRQGMQEETAFSTLPFKVQQQAETLKLTLNCDLNKIIVREKTLEIGITTVIKNQNGEVSYWALNHPAAEADFHRRDSFIILL